MSKIESSLTAMVHHRWVNQDLKPIAIAHTNLHHFDSECAINLDEPPRPDQRGAIAPQNVSGSSPHPENINPADAKDSAIGHGLASSGLLPAAG